MIIQKDHELLWEVLKERKNKSVMYKYVTDKNQEIVIIIFENNDENLQICRYENNNLVSAIIDESMTFIMANDSIISMINNNDNTDKYLLHYCINN